MLGDMDGDEAVGRFVERFAALLVDSGMARMPARVFARLLAADSGQLTAAELAEALHVSPAAISGAVRYLTQVGLVVRTRERGARKDTYVVHDDVWGEMYTQQAAQLRRWIEVADEAATALGPDRPAGRRLADTRDFFAFMHAELPGLIRRWRDASEAPAARRGAG
jgi:DNA-binding transcriptional regulator GbsR (MarR family)